MRRRTRDVLRSRLSILALAGVMAGGCATGTTPVPSASRAIPSATPVATGTPRPSVSMPSPSPTPTSCPTPGTDFLLTLDTSFLLGRSDLKPAVDRIVSIDDPAESFQPPPLPEWAEGRSYTGVVPGGYAIPVDLQILLWGAGADIDSESASVELDVASAVLTSVTATFTLATGEEVPIDVRVDMSDTEMRHLVLDAAPDVDAEATLALNLEWTDRCYRWSASGTSTVQLVSSAKAAPCLAHLGDEEDDWFWRDLRALFEPPLRVEGSDVDFVFELAESRYLPVGALGADGYSLAHWDRHRAPVVAAPGTVLRVAYPNPNVKLLTMESWVYRRRDVVRTLDAGYPFPDIDAVSHTTAARQPDWTFRLRVPAKPGRYVVDLMIFFDSAAGCFVEGSRAWALFSLDVVEPDASASPTT